MKSKSLNQLIRSYSAQSHEDQEIILFSCYSNRPLFPKLVAYGGRPPKYRMRRNKYGICNHFMVTVFGWPDPNKAFANQSTRIYLLYFISSEVHL